MGEKLLEHLIHEPLEDWWLVGEPIQHHPVLIVVSRCDEGCLPLVSRANPNEAVGALQVQFGEDVSSTEFL